MKKPKNVQLGIMFRREHPPEALPGFARRAEAAGFDELWVVEDCSYWGGIASSAVALACTDTIKVGLGILPAVVRNPVYAAMEIATLARLYPGRFYPGLGHGLGEWMRQVGAFPKSPLQALEEVTSSIRELLAGETVTFHGQHVHIDQARLVHPPAQIPPVSLGVIGPKSLALSGRVADGTILSEYAAPAYVSWSKDQIARGKLQAGHHREHRLTVFSIACAAATTAAARQRLRPWVAGAIASGGIDPKLAAMGILTQAQEYRESGGQANLEAKMPDTWIDLLAIAGTAEDWESAINRLTEVGVHSVILVPLPDASLDEVEVFSRHYLL